MQRLGRDIRLDYDWSKTIFCFEPMVSRHQIVPRLHPRFLPTWPLPGLITSHICFMLTIWLSNLVRISGWLPQLTDSERLNRVQEVNRGVLSETTPARGWGKRSWAEGAARQVQ